MYQFIKISTEKISSLFFSFLFAGTMYLFLVGSKNGFSTLFQNEFQLLAYIFLVAVIYVSPFVLFIGIPFSFLASFISKKVRKYQSIVRLVLYVALAVTIGLVSGIFVGSIEDGLVAKDFFIMQMGVASALGFWCGEEILKIVVRKLKEKNIILMPK